MAHEGQGDNSDGGWEAAEVKVLPAPLALPSVLQNHPLCGLAAKGEESDKDGEEDEEDEDDAQRAPLCQPGHVPARKGRS